MVGISGGRPSSSYYLVGSQGDNLFYLDPLKACDPSGTGFRTTSTVTTTTTTDESDNDDDGGGEKKHKKKKKKKTKCAGPHQPLHHSLSNKLIVASHLRWILESICALLQPQESKYPSSAFIRCAEHVPLCSGGGMCVVVFFGMAG